MRHIFFKVYIVFLGMIGLLFFIGCQSSRSMAYLSDAERDSAMAIIHNYTSTLRVGDQLYIHVSSDEPASVIPFNQETNQLQPAKAKEAKVTSNVNVLVTTKEAVVNNQIEQNAQFWEKTAKMRRTYPYSYLVKGDGTLSFPMLGDISVAGMTQDALNKYIAQRLRDEGYVLDPVVESSLLNFRVTVIGEVKSPGEYRIEGNRLTIFEALALAQDATIHGLRNKVVVIRQTTKDSNVQSNANANVNANAKPEASDIAILDLTSKDCLDSPYYYLQPNDIVYVTPDNYQRRISNRNKEIPKYLSLTVATAALARTILNVITRLMRN